MQCYWHSYFLRIYCIVIFLLYNITHNLASTTIRIAVFSMFVFEHRSMDYVCVPPGMSNSCIMYSIIVYRSGYFTVPPRLQVEIVVDPKMWCHQKSFGIWKVTEAILGKKCVFFFKKHILEKINNKSHYFKNF